jgi:rhamnosyltransferase subunit B
MAKIVLATFGSLGDVHPKIALGLELKRRGHDVTLAAMEFYREKAGMLGFNFAPMSPHLDPEDRDLVREMMDVRKGSERILRDIIIGNIRPMYDDLTAAVAGADLMITGEAVYAAVSVAEKTGIKWVSTSLAPVSFFSAYDPPVPPHAPWFEKLYLGPGFNSFVFTAVRWAMGGWLKPYRQFRRDIGLDPDHDPIFYGKFSKELHMALFSEVLGGPQPDWPPNTVQTGFCFYDGQADTGTMPPGLAEFLDAGEPPIVFTLGSAAVMDPGEFFEQSAEAAALLGRRAVLVYGIFNPPPKGLTDEIAGFDYAPYSLLFPRASCIVHQGGVGTTGQALRAGVPQLIMPYSHDQPDNALRCRRLGVGEYIARGNYSAAAAAEMIRKILSTPSYALKAATAGETVRSEGGSRAACDAIEESLK